MPLKFILLVYKSMNSYDICHINKCNGDGPPFIEYLLIGIVFFILYSIIKVDLLGGIFMRNFIEKSFIISFCLFNSYSLNPSSDLVFYFLFSLIISLILDLFPNKKIKVSIYIIFLILSLYKTSFLFYLPLILYNMYLDYNIYCFFAFILIINNFFIMNLLTGFISIYFSFRTKRFNLFLKDNKLIRDELKEDTIYLKKYNEQLKIDKEKNIHIAILTERNRIARELHDSIGHSISSSILQVGALKMIAPEDTMEDLNLLQKTLSDGMDNIRKSIHNLYKESLDLESSIEKICSEVPGINIDLNYQIEDNLVYDLKFDILSLVKESINNCIKHSNATNLWINLIDQPKFYSIVIRDNGTKYDNDKSKINTGIGLLSMEDIARKYNGFLNYEFNQGFKIHLTLMKG